MDGSAGRDGRLTEAINPRTTDIDRADARTIVATMQGEDRAVGTAVESQGRAIARVVEEVAGRFRRGGRLVYVGAGTSGRLGVLDASECPPTFGTSPDLVRGLIAGGSEALVRSSEGAEDDPEAGGRAIADLEVGRHDFVLGIATSGTTPYVHGALAEAHRRHAGLGFLSCATPPEDVTRLDPILITPLVGPEVLAGSTRLKAGTATKLVLNAITTGAMIRTGRVYRNLMVDLRARSAKLVDRGIRIVSHVTGLDREAARTLLVAADGDVKTALAMHELELPRGLAERCLDAVDGFLGAAIERFAAHRGGGDDFPFYTGYPERPGWPDVDGLIADLRAAPGRLAAAAERGADVDAGGGRVRGNPGGWHDADHAAHLLDFEEEAVGPRIRSVLEKDVVAWDSWEAVDPPSRGGAPFGEVLARFEAARSRTIEGLEAAPDGAFERRARLGAERPTLYQFLRGVRQHDEAHARRIEGRVHPDLLSAGRPGESR